RIRIIRDLDVAVYTHPADCHGVSLEFFTESFHEDERLTGGPMRPSSYWRDEHPLALTGLHGLTHVTPDLEATAQFFCDLLDAQPMDEQERPAIGGRAVALQVADMVLEVLTPTGPGRLKEHLERHGEGLRSTVFRVHDLDKACAHLSAHGIDPVTGTAPSAVAIPAEQNLGVIFELVQHDG
ncbi:MAG TPA: VOC family protein, partial [Acidimicrobiales bacterium]